MKLIIDFPEEAYQHLLKEQRLPNELDLEYFVMHGVPLDDIKKEIIKERDRDISGNGNIKDWLNGYKIAFNIALAIIDEESAK